MWDNACRILFPIAFVSDFNRGCILDGIESFLHHNLAPEIDFLSVIADDQIPLHQPGSRSRTALRHALHIGRVIPRHRHHYHGNQKCQDKIKERACKNYLESLPDRLVIKRLVIIDILVLPDHHTCAPDREKTERVQCTALFDTEKFWSHAKTKLRYANPVFLSKEKMSELVKNHHKAKH